jgi:hypothetical protein
MPSIWWRSVANAGASVRAVAPDGWPRARRCWWTRCFPSRAVFSRNEPILNEYPRRREPRFRSIAAAGGQARHCSANQVSE